MNPVTAHPQHDHTLLLERDFAPEQSTTGLALRQSGVSGLNPKKQPLVFDLNPYLEPAALRQLGRGALVWLIALLVGAALVMYFLGSLFAARDQRNLTAELKLQTEEAVGAVKNSLSGPAPVTRAPELGSAVAVLQIPRIRLQQAVVEGAGSAQTQSGPGHVAGTAGLGQPGNSVLVGRASAFGAPFAELSKLRVGDPLIVTTPQGKSVYTITKVGEQKVSVATYDSTETDQLTLLSSTTWWPFQADKGLQVTAKLNDAPFVPTPQNGRSDQADGRHGDPKLWPLLILELLGLGICAAVSTAMYRNWSAPATYLLSAPALLGLMVLTGLTTVKLLPGWF